MFRLIAKRISQRQFITVIKQAEVGYREFLGSNRKKLESGVHLNLPILHTLHKVDLREQGVLIDEIFGFTKDNVPIRVVGTLFFVVDNSEQACFSVKNYVKSVKTVGESTVRSIIGKFEYDTITSERNLITEELVKTIGLSIKSWGTFCTRFEIQNLSPANKSVNDVLEVQMRGERSRRENELNTLAKINTSSGEKQSQILISEANLIEQKNKADGDLYKVEKNTQAIMNQISELKKQLDVSDTNILNFILEKERIANLTQISSGDNKQIYFLDPKGVTPTQYMKIEP